MRLALLKSKLFPDLFVVDEPREVVFADEEILRTPAVDGQTETPRNPWEQAGNDLVTEVGHLLLEQVRLEQKAKMLESGQGGDEFAKFAKQVLPFMDNFWRLLELAREHPPSDELTNWLTNFESLYFRFVRLMESFGFVFINSLGKEVNLDYHEVVEYRPTTEHPHNYIIKELEKGVVFRNRLLRDAKVVVAYNP